MKSAAARRSQRRSEGSRPEPAAGSKRRLLVHTETESFCYDEFQQGRSVDAVAERFP